MEDADASCHTRKRCCLAVGMFIWPDRRCIVPGTCVCVDETVYRRHAGCRKQHFAAQLARDFKVGVSFMIWGKVNYCQPFILRERLISYSWYCFGCFFVCSLVVYIWTYIYLEKWPYEARQSHLLKYLRLINTSNFCIWSFLCWCIMCIVIWTDIHRFYGVLWAVGIIAYFWTSLHIDSVSTLRQFFQNRFFFFNAWKSQSLCRSQILCLKNANCWIICLHFFFGF